MQIPGPYLIFLGDVESDGHAKTGFGLAQWCPEQCLGQLRYAGCQVDLGLADMSLLEAVNAGAKALVIGVAPSGGALKPYWLDTFKQAIGQGLSIVSGLHNKLTDYPELTAAAATGGVKLIDVRVPPANISVASGKKRTGKRLLTVGTDCTAGKKYAALSLTKAMKSRGYDCDFRATGQTGIMIAGQGIPMDAVVSDFVAGAAELISPDNAAAHWDVIEGQGSLFHPAYAGVSLGLLHGSQPDALVICHDPTRQHLLGWPEYPVPDIKACIERNLIMARLTNPLVRAVGICINSSKLSEAQRAALIKELSSETGLPCVDPILMGVDAIVDNL